jgi:hypothetical protein
MNSDKFLTIAESLRRHQRADLRDYETQLDNPVETLYVDPLPNDAMLKSALSRNTTFLVGRKGTGKSTIFARAQSDIRKQPDLLSIYIDVKALYDLISANETPVQVTQIGELSEEILRAHLLRKHFLGSIVKDIISELEDTASKLNLWNRWTGKRHKYEEAIRKVRAVGDQIVSPRLTEEEIPILRLVEAKTKAKEQAREQRRNQARGSAGLAPLGPTIALATSLEDFDEALSEQEVYTKYSDAVLRSFPFAALLSEIRDLLLNANITRLVVFLDDFSELNWLDQRLFVDVILAPLNNSSLESIKLKVAAYPGRIYYGRIDPSKVDTLYLDFSLLYKAADIQTAEQNAIDYTKRLLTRRFEAFGENIQEYFDSSTDQADYFRTIFEVTLNVPRLMGYLLHQLYLDRVAKGQPITTAAIRLAAQKYYDTVTAKYFDRMNRYALEPFDKKLDRHNQAALLRMIVDEAKQVRREIASGELGGAYFHGIVNPPVSHFSVTPALEKVLSSLELNFLVSKYHEMRNKDGEDVTIYALSFGLCEAERLPWGYPSGRRDDRSYFVQRCFDYTRAIHQFLSKNQTIRCDNCTACFSMDQRDKFEFFKWRCPDCDLGKCQIINLGEEFRQEVEVLDEKVMLDPVELQILESLHEERTAMRAGEISMLLDTTYQLVGKRTEKLRDMGLVDKEWKDGFNRSEITDRAESIYFRAGEQG